MRFSTRFRSALSMVALSLSLPAGALAQAKPEAKPADAPRPALTVAVLDFEARDPGNPDLGKQLADIVSALLSGEVGFTLVDRASMEKTLKEHEVNQTGLVDNDQAIKVGKLVGARLMIVGKIFPVQKQLYMTAKVIGTETSLVEAVLAKGASDAGPDELATKISQEIAKRIREKGRQLVAADDELDPIPALKAKISKLKTPTVAVIVTEEHVTQRVIDPAVETEIKKTLIDCGFTVQDVPQNDLADWSKLTHKDDVKSWPRGMSKADYVITGAAISELGSRIGNLVSCSARAEINVINHKDGRIVHADRANTRGIDLAENIAGKKALQNAGRQISVKMLEYFAGSLPPADAGRP